MELQLDDGVVQRRALLRKRLRDQPSLGIDAHRTSQRHAALDDVAKLSKEVVLENVGIGISPTRMKCAMLGLRVLKSAAIGEIAGWPDEE